MARLALFFGPGGLRAKWRALLFVVGMVLALELTLLGVNALSARGLLRYSGAWNASVEWAAFAAALLATLAASLLERRRFGDYGLPLRAASGRRFSEGALWGIVAVSLLLLTLIATRSLAFSRGERARDALVPGAVWAAAMLGMALFEQLSTRGYLQFTLARAIGFWPAAWLLSVLFALENLLSPAYRDPLSFVSSTLFGMLCCLMLRRTGSLWFAAGFQAALCWAAVFVYGFGIPLARVAQSLLRPVFDGPGWLTGGASGPDGSVLMWLLLALLGIGVRRRFPHESSYS